MRRSARRLPGDVIVTGARVHVTTVMAHHSAHPGPVQGAPSRTQDAGQGRSGARAESKPLAIARLVEEKQAQAIVVMDLRSLATITDFFVLCTGRTGRQVQAIANHVAEGLRAGGDPVWHVEGYRDAQWVLLDCGDTVVHIFQPSTREFYGLEHLWGDLPTLRRPAEEPRQAAVGG